MIMKIRHAAQVAACLLSGVVCGADGERAETTVRRAPEWLVRGAMYQVQLRAFTPEGTLKAAAARLPSLKALGITSVYLWPPNVADDDPDKSGWSKRQVASGCDNPRNPFRVKDYWHVDPEYGTDDDLKAFVAEAHRLGLKVLLDVVYVHCGPNNPLVREHPEFFRRKDGKIEKSKWNFPMISMESPAARRYFIGNMAYWMRDFGIDGFRCDSSDLLPVSFWEECREALEKVSPDVVMLAEGSRKENLYRAFDCNYDWAISIWGIRESLKGAVKASELRRQYGVSLGKLPPGGLALHFTENHDLANDEYGDRLERTLGHDNQAAGLFLVFLLDGAPLLYTGQEICDESRHSIYGRMGVDWSRAGDPAACERQNLIRRLTAIRRDNAIVAHAPTTWLDNDRPDEVVSFERGGPSPGRVFAIANLSAKNVRVKVAGASPSSLSTLLGARASASGDAFELGPWGFLAASETSAGNVDDIDFTECDVTGKLAALAAAASNETYQVVQAAHGLADEMFVVGVGQPNALPFMWRRPDGATAPARRISFRVCVPRAFRLVDASLAERGTTVRKVNADGSSEVTFRMSYSSQVPRREFQSFSRPALLVDAEGPVGSEGDLTLEVLLDGRVVSNRMKTRLKAVEPVRVSRKPRKFGAGGHLGGHYYIFSEDSSTFAFAKTLGEVGFDWAITSRTNASLKAALRAAGFRYVIYDYYWAADGFRIGDPKGRPEADKWVQGDDEKIKNPTDNLSCPMAIYEEREFFLKNSLPKMRRSLDGFDGMWGNWEPEPYRGHGCACSNCLEAARATGVPLPQFRAEQIAKVVRTVDRHVRAATGGEKSLGFIPAVNWILMSTDKIFYDRGYEFWPGLYAKDVKCINPWGPYLFWDTQWKYNPKNHDGMLVEQFVAAKDVRECVDRECPAERRPYLMGFPHADESSRGGNLWIVPSSWIDLAVSSQFFNRWEASVLYYFPRGNDARYLKSFARAVERAAEYEPFVWDGRRVDGLVKAAATPETRKVRPKFRWNMRKYTDMPFLQFAAYDLGGERIVAAFNFSGLDSVDFDLSQTGLDGSYSLSVDGVRLDGAKSAAELERGIRLTLEPNTCCVYRFTKL